jgi:hypothetical protein
MPFRIQQHASLIRITFSGVVTKADLTESIGELARIEATCDPIPDRLTDLTGVVDRDWDPGKVLQAAKTRRAEEFPNPFRSAVVAPTPVAFGFARMFQTLNDHPKIEVRVFKTMADAEAWLEQKA